MHLAPQTGHRLSPPPAPTKSPLTNCSNRGFKQLQRGGIRSARGELRTGDLIVLRPGDRVPMDGLVVEGDSAVDESMFTGESAARGQKEGRQLYAGTMNLNGRLVMRVTATGEATALAQHHRRRATCPDQPCRHPAAGRPCQQRICPHRHGRSRLTAGMVGLGPGPAQASLTGWRDFYGRCMPRMAGRGGVCHCGGGVDCRMSLCHGPGDARSHHGRGQCSRAPGYFDSRWRSPGKSGHNNRHHF